MGKIFTLSLIFLAAYVHSLPILEGELARTNQLRASFLASKLLYFWGFQAGLVHGALPELQLLELIIAGCRVDGARDFDTSPRNVCCVGTGLATWGVIQYPHALCVDVTILLAFFQSRSGMSGQTLTRSIIPYALFDVLVS